jgi:protein-arginine kinase activator protein McsA
MLEHAENMEFEQAARIRDEIEEFEKEMETTV